MDSPEGEALQHIEKHLGALPNNWAKLDPLSRASILLIGMASASISEKKLPDETALLGVSVHGSLYADLLFWKSLSNTIEEASPQLFVLTLPSIPLSQAAIVHKIKGPVLAFLSNQKENIMELGIEKAKNFILSESSIHLVYALSLDLIPQAKGTEPRLQAELAVIMS